MNLPGGKRRVSAFEIQCRLSRHQNASQARAHLHEKQNKNTYPCKALRKHKMRDRQVPEDEKERRPDHAQNVNEDPPKDSTHALCFSVGNGPVSRSRPAFSKAPDRCEKRPSVAALPIHQGDRGTRRRLERSARRRQEDRRGTARRPETHYFKGTTGSPQGGQRTRLNHAKEVPIGAGGIKRAKF